MKQRSKFWDNYKGILIVLVVFGHFIYDYATNMSASRVNDIFRFIYLFHMPAFVLCSGYFSKSENACSKKSIVKLLLCYVAINSPLMFYYWSQGSAVQLITPYASAWYILALIVWRLSIKHLAQIKGILPISVIAAILIGFWTEFSNVLSLSRIVAFFPFFLVGYRLNETKLQTLLQKRTVLKSILGYVLALLIAVCLLVVVSKTDITVAMLTMQPYNSGKEMLYRGFIMLAAAVVIAAMMVTVPNRNIPILTKLGKNSLLVYLVHRLITLIFFEIFPHTNYSRIYLVYALVGTVAVLLIFGSDLVNKWFNSALNWLSDEISNSKSKVGRRIVSLMLVLALLISGVPFAEKAISVLKRETATQVNVSEVIDDTVVLSFVGDLILLKDQVESAYDEETGEYLFDPVFEYTKDYFSNSDLTIGIFEGPTAGHEKGYSTSDYYDHGMLYLNFPDSFAQAVKDSGIDVVSTANNHLLDMGPEGAMRTLDVLDEVGLLHTGSYRDQSEKDQILFVEVDGIKIALLSYTWAMNYRSNDEIITNYPYITSILPDKEDARFPELMEEIREDFEQAKDQADLVVVLPHMGTQFSHETDEFQNYWNQTFSELGADIILGDHAHAVQPIEQIGDTIVVNCPGNFANSYIQYDGDATAIVEVYIDTETKKPVATAVVPMYTQEMKNGFFRALPIYEILSQSELYEQMTNIDLERITQVHELITEVMLGKKLGVTDVQPRYFYIDGQYREKQYSLLENFSEEYKDAPLYQQIASASTVVYIGDSITNGSHNNGHPWYEPLMAQFGQKNVVNISKPSYTVSDLIRDFSAEISQSNGELYIVAIGTNDIRYRNEQICAMTPQEYVSDIDELVSLILEANNDAQIVLLSPWMTLSNDRNSQVGHAEKLELILAYSEALSAYAKENGYCFLNPNEQLFSFYETNQRYQYTNDGVHPNDTKGIDLYSWAVMESSMQDAH